MTGFHGQKFDFLGEDGEWYCVVQDGSALQLNMRVTSPVPSMPEITYITGISVMATDTDGLEHTIAIQVTDPSSLDSSCPVGVSPCLANGALTVDVDGREVLLSPGSVSVGPDMAIAAVNLPGACRYTRTFVSIRTSSPSSWVMYPTAKTRTATSTELAPPATSYLARPPIVPEKCGKQFPVESETIYDPFLKQT